jgi:hypothetical protein
MDIPQETPNWKLNISQKLAERDKGNIDFSNLISQLNTTKDKLKEYLNRVNELEKTVDIIQQNNKKSGRDPLINELCQNQLKLSKKMTNEMNLNDKIKALETKLLVTQTKLEKSINQKHDLEQYNKRVLLELRKTREEVCHMMDERVVLQLENHFMRTDLEENESN